MEIKDKELLEQINCTEDDFPRFRNVYDEGDIVCVETRSGGDNRDWLAKYIEKVQEKPNYLYDEDDDFDCTYMYFYFKKIDKLP